MVKRPTVLNSNISAPATGVTLYDPDYKVRDLFREVVNLEILAVSGTPTFSAQPQQSLDGVSWHNIGSAITTAGLTVLTVNCPYFQAPVNSLSGGNLTITAG